MIAGLQPEDHIPPERLERGLKLVIYDGIAAQVMGTLTGGAFLVAFALLLGANNFVIGLISALQPLTQVLQIPTIYVVERVGLRKLLVISTLFVGRLFCFGLALIPWFVPESQRIEALVVLLLAYFGLGTVSGVAWNPWIRDLIPEHRLSSYMASRLAITTAVGAVLSLIAAVGVDYYSAQYQPLAIYAVYFALAGVAGLAGVYFIARVPEPRIHHNPNISLFRLLREPVADRNFRQLLIFLGTWNFAVNFAAPFFTVYMLTRLHLGMSAILALSVLSQMVNVFFFKLWARLAERFSYKSVLLEAGPLFILTFLLWPLTTFGDWPLFTYAALFFIHASTGMSTAGVRLCTGNLAMKLAPRGKATAYLSINALTSGITATIAPILGGLAATLFEGEEIVFSFTWQSALMGAEAEVQPITLAGLDFVFILAFVFGLYSLHRLVTIHEDGEVERGVVLSEFDAQVRKALGHVSNMDGLLDLVYFPYGRLVELFNRRKTKRPDPHAPSMPK